MTCSRRTNATVSDGRSWKLTPITAQPAGVVVARTAASTGSSSSHGWHHDAKNAITTGWPRSAESVTVAPVVDRSVKSGAGGADLRLARVDRATRRSWCARRRRRTVVMRLVREDQRERPPRESRATRRTSAAIAARDGRRGAGVVGRASGRARRRQRRRTPASGRRSTSRRSWIAACGVGVAHQRERPDDEHARRARTPPPRRSGRRRR